MPTAVATPRSGCRTDGGRTARRQGAAGTGDRTVESRRPCRLHRDALPGRVTLTGLQAMLDPPRAAAIPAVAALHSAGHRGEDDHRRPPPERQGRLPKPLACSTAEKSGDQAVLTGSELAELSPDELPDAVEQASVFARVSPEQKLRLVEALQGKGHVVAMTGDGVTTPRRCDRRASGWPWAGAAPRSPRTRPIWC